MRTFKTKFFLIGAVFFWALSGICRSEEIPPLPDFRTHDRIMIFAPHPDDEAIAAGGVIQRALGAGAKVKVVCYTCGDLNEPAFIVYEKRIPVKTNGFVYMGKVRKKETLSAMASLGLSPGDVVFLGYPDFGTMDILTKCWDETKPFKSVFTRISSVPYKDALSYGAPYTGQSILNDVKTVVRDFRPTMIFVSHPADTNRDHRSLYLFLTVALWDLEGKINQPSILPYLVHMPGWPKPRGYHGDLALAPPEKLAGPAWLSLCLESREIEKKKEAIAYYKSQISYNPPYLFTFARKNELFGDFPPVRLKRQIGGAGFLWQDLQSNGVFTGAAEAGQASTEDDISGISYAYKDEALYVKFSLKRRLIGGPVGLGMYLLGYKKRGDFSIMPKLYISVDNRGVRVKDKKKPLFVKGITTQRSGKTVVVKIPLSVLGNPTHFLCNIRSQRKDLPLSDLAWRVLILES
ncbi:MAG: PIG-L family deacetylase [Candidatus Omnitrophota bacterium]